MSAEQAAGPGTGVLPLIDHDDAIDDHHLDAFGVLVRIVKAGAVGNRLGVEQDEIGSVADGDRTAFRKAGRRGRAAGHLADGSRQAEKAEIAGVMSQNPRKGSIEPGMRLALPGDPVRSNARTVGADYDER